MQKITDRSGNSVVYELARSPFGFKGRYRNEPAKDYLYDICYINGEELKLYTEGNSAWFIQPVNYEKYAGRPSDVFRGGEDNTIPYDPQARRQRKKQITIEKIIVPAIYVTALSLVPAVIGLLMLKCISHFNFYHSLFYIIPSMFALDAARRIILSRIRKFQKASYFKQHSWTFFLLGVASMIGVLIMMLVNYRLPFLH